MEQNIEQILNKLETKALLIATDGHYGIYRKDRTTPYITHPIKVAEIATEKYEEVYGDHQSGSGFKTIKSLIKIAGYFHDLVEDVEKWKNKESELLDYLEHVSDVKIPMKDTLLDALMRLNKFRHDGYLNFVLAAKQNIVSKFVKYGDLTHNSSDLQKGALLDKYKLSLYIIQHDFVEDVLSFLKDEY